MGLLHAQNLILDLLNQIADYHYQNLEQYDDERQLEVQKNIFFASALAAKFPGIITAEVINRAHSLGRAKAGVALGLAHDAYWKIDENLLDIFLKIMSDPYPAKA